MGYSRLANVKNSLYFYIKSEMENLGYLFDENNWSFVDEYPEVTLITLPTMSLSYLLRGIRSNYDLGNDALYSYNFVLDAFCRNNLERENWTEDVAHIVEKRWIDCLDFNQATPTVEFKLVPEDVRAEKITVIEPTNVEKYRAAVYFTVVLKDKY